MSESPVRAGVRFAFRTHIRGLVPASDVNWPADVRSKVSVHAFGHVADRAVGRCSLSRFRQVTCRYAGITCRVPVEQAPRRYEASDLPYSAAALIRPPKSAVLQHLKYRPAGGTKLRKLLRVRRIPRLTTS
jgi:hypothetical protein